MAYITDIYNIYIYIISIDFTNPLHICALSQAAPSAPTDPPVLLEPRARAATVEADLGSFQEKIG